VRVASTSAIAVTAATAPAHRLIAAALLIAATLSLPLAAQEVPSEAPQSDAEGVTIATATPPAPVATPDREPGEADHPLRPYKATYKTSARGLSLTLRRSLSMDQNGDCRLTSEGRILVAGISEVSVFAVEGDQVSPKSYVYQLSGPVSRRREVHFNTDSDVIRSLYKKEWYELPKAPGTLDRMSQQEQLRLLLLNDPTPRDDIRLRVADGRKVKDYELYFVGEEIIDTPMGSVVTLHFEREHDDPDDPGRRSAFWVAPAWDFLLVKTLHVEEGRATEANLVSASIEGEPVRAAERG
jgi:hypothetical protein